MKKKNWIRDTFDAYCTEMEGAAIAQAAYLNQIPYLIVRAISDKADDSANVDYSEFEAKRRGAFGPPYGSNAGRVFKYRA